MIFWPNLLLKYDTGIGSLWVMKTDYIQFEEISPEEVKVKSVHKSSRSHLTSTVSDLYVHQKIKALLARKKLGFIDRESNLIRQRAKQKAEALVYKELVIAYRGRVGHKISRTLVSTLTMYLKGKHRNDSHHRSQITQRHNPNLTDNIHSYSLRYIQQNYFYRKWKIALWNLQFPPPYQWLQRLSIKEHQWKDICRKHGQCFKHFVK